MADDKKAELKSHNEATVSMAKEFAKEVVGEAVAAAVAAVQAQHVKNTAKAEKALPKPGCDVCGQQNMACGGKHRKLFVMPAINAEYFPGIKLNGVTYLSAGGVPIDIPADANFEYMLAEWDRNEREMQQGRKRLRYSGSVGNSGRGVRPISAEDFFR